MGRRRNNNTKKDATTALGVLITLYFLGKKALEWLGAHSNQIILGFGIVLLIISFILLLKIFISFPKVSRKVSNTSNMSVVSTFEGTINNENNTLVNLNTIEENKQRKQVIFEKWQHGQKERERGELKKRALFESGINEIDMMTGIEFEKRMAILFSNHGYKASLTPNTDFGGDIILESKDNKKLVVQCKRWNSKVGVKAVQEILTAVQYYDADEGIILTNNYLTTKGKELADKVKIKVWDRNKLIELLITEETQRNSKTTSI